MSDTVRLDIADGIATVTIDRPQAMNAVDVSIREGLTVTFTKLRGDAAVRAVILTASGDRAFTAGQDLNELVVMDADAGEAWIRGLGRLYQSIRDLDQPTVVALNGVASGAGLQMALHADLRLAVPHVRMGQPEVAAGLPSVLGPWVMHACMGLGATREMSLSGRFVDAETSLRYGLVDRIVPAERLMAEAMAEARSLAARPEATVRAIKRHLRAVTQPGWDATIAAGVDMVREAFAAGEPQRVAAAFLAKRAARRKG